MIITGFLHGKHIMIGCVYAPNVYQEFYSTLVADASEMFAAFSILGGDFNCVMNPEVDQSPLTKVTSKMREATRELCVDLQLFDVWRTLHPRGKDSTFFSHPHQSFSRIDYFFVSRMVLDRVEECTIGTQLLSDHADVSIMVSPPSPKPTPRHWRLNPSLFNNPSFMEKQINIFLSTNDSDDTNPSILWDTLKAYLRGALISYSTARKREALREQLSLERQFTDLDKELKDNYSATLSKKTEATRSALNQLLTQKAEASIFYAKHRLFEMGDKPG